LAKCEFDKIFNPYRLYVYGTDNVVWVIQGSNFVHKRKEIDVDLGNLGEGCVEDLVGKPEGKRILGRPRYRWEDNTKMGPKEVE